MAGKTDRLNEGFVFRAGANTSQTRAAREVQRVELSVGAWVCTSLARGEGTRLWHGMQQEGSN